MAVKRTILRLRSLLQRWMKRIIFSSIATIQKESEANRLNDPTDIAKRYSGKLLLREEILLNDSLFFELLSSHYFTTYPSIQNSFFSRICTRCNNKNPNLFAYIPCSICGKNHYYCRNCIMMGRVMECQLLYFWTKEPYPWPQWNAPCSWSGTLTEAQRHAAHCIVQTVQRKTELLIWAVTGSGKTEMLFPGITEALRTGLRICIATPRTDVVRELYPRVQDAFCDVPIQALYSGSRDNDGTTQLIISTTHQLLRFKEAFDVIIVDEIDAFPYHHDSSLQFAVKRAAKRKAAFIYLTATPRKEQKRRMSLKRLSYVFVPQRFHGFPLPVPKLVQSSYSSFQKETPLIPKQFTSWLTKRTEPNRQLLIFVPTITQATKLLPVIANILFEKQVIKTDLEVTYVYSEDKQREEKIEQFRKQQLRVLVTTTILERGVTFPSVDVVVLDAHHDVFDEAALVQIAGRAGRSAKDPYGEVIFLYRRLTGAIVQAKKAIEEMNRRATISKNEET